MLVTVLLDNKKSIILCADDFGLTPSISKAICQLVSLRRLSAVSTIVTTPFIADAAKTLLAINSPIQIGLHLNLTEGFYLSKPKQRFHHISCLCLKSHLRLLSLSTLQAEIDMQLHQFMDIFQKMPDFIDGHQHVHQFPVVRDGLLKVYRQYFPNHEIPIRCNYPLIALPEHRLKAWALVNLGGKALKRLLDQEHIPHNKAFSGVYPFAFNVDYRSLFQRWLACVPPHTLFLCHPGFNESDSDDLLTICRQQEWDYFSSDDFVRDLDLIRIKT